MKRSNDYSSARQARLIQVNGPQLVQTAEAS
jgi:hypothetical protein